MDLPDWQPGRRKPTHHARTIQAESAFAGAASSRQAIVGLHLSPAPTGQLSGSSAAQWVLPPRHGASSSRPFSLDTLSFIAVYIVAMLAALIAPPAQAIGLRDNDAPADGHSRGIQRTVSVPMRYTVEASAPSIPTMDALPTAKSSARREASAAVTNRAREANLGAAVTEYEDAEQALRAGGLAELLDQARESFRAEVSPGAAGSPLVLGMYTSASLQVSASELKQIDGWLADNGLSARVTIAGTFMDFEFPNPEWNIPHDLEAAWKQGDIPFVNLAVGTTDLGPRSAQDVARGVADSGIRTWARLFAKWTEGGKKWAYIAPLQEMNGGWVTYGLDPAGYQEAYLRVQRIFGEEGVPEGSVVWVFAPNGWSEPGHEFEKYYPGDEHVDVVAFSAFNFGACSCYAKTWDTFEGAFRPYLQRMREMAPDKPIFVAQTGTVAQGGDKDAWLLNTFTGLDEFDGVEAVIYFNVAKPEAGGAACPIVDWRLFDPNSGHGQQGFLAAIERMEHPGRGTSSDHSSSQAADEGSDTGEDEGSPGKPKKSKDSRDREEDSALPAKAHPQVEARS